MPRRLASSRPSRATRHGGPKGKEPVRYAVVGLGYISQVAVLPAFEHARENSRLVALVSDDAAKLKELSARYEVALTGGYDDLDPLLASGEIDAVYIALPNSLHREYAVRAARAGIHVLCEKPMALTEEDCQAMIGAARASDVRLMIAYRLHFERTNLAAVEIARSGKLGDLRYFDSTFSMQVRDPKNIRLDRELGGGPLWDIGVYCINAARYLFQDEPIEVFAMTASGRDRRFREVEEMMSATLRFPADRLASFTCSIGAADVASYRLVGTLGDLVVEPAYEYAEGLKYRLTVGGRSAEHAFRRSDQFAPELIYFSDCIHRRREPEPSGREGLADVRVIRALYRAAEQGRPVHLGSFEKRKRPAAEQEIRKPAVRRPRLVHARPPSKG